MEKNKDPGDNKMPQGWLFMSNYLSLIRRTAAILIFSLSSSLFTVPNIWIIINFDFMKESHFQGLEESSYLGEDTEKMLSFDFCCCCLGKAANKAKWKKYLSKREKYQRKWSFPSTPSLLLDGGWESGLFSPLPLRSSRSSDPFPSSAQIRAERNVPASGVGVSAGFLPV